MAGMARRWVRTATPFGWILGADGSRCPRKSTLRKCLSRPEKEKTRFPLLGKPGTRDVRAELAFRARFSVAARRRSINSEEASCQGKRPEAEPADRRVAH